MFTWMGSYELDCRLKKTREQYHLFVTIAVYLQRNSAQRYVLYALGEDSRFLSSNSGLLLHLNFLLTFFSFINL